ncbi:hypothetical protein AB0L53_31820 [Nonomuraea sp. NPDC052129]|uniref:hypothetical protein n=1 Tax=Nonomuraea sp. NPDC052129 TaxID=3154651 RepID=UPI00343DC1E4
MPAWLESLDIADKVASVLGLLVAITSLIATIRYARQSVHRRTEQPQDEPEEPANHDVSPRPAPRPVYAFQNEPGKEGQGEMIWTLAGLAMGWILLLMGAFARNNHGVPGGFMAIVLGYLVIAGAAYHTWATDKFYRAVGTPARLGRWGFAVFLSMILAGIIAVTYMFTNPGILR